MPPLATTATPFKFLPFFGSAISSGAGFAIGMATAPTLRPVLQSLENAAWARAPTQPLDPQTAALAEIEGLWDHLTAEDEAGNTGLSPARYEVMRRVNDEGITLALAFEAWRRDLLTDAQFDAALQKSRLEKRWWPALRALKGRLLTLADLANARQQGFVDAARQKDESQLQGLGSERAEILFELAGLPLGVETMQQALNRGLVTRAEFDQAIREGHTKTKYTDLAESLRHPVLNASEYATLHLKGWITEAEMNAGGALHGFTAAQMNLMYLERGRPAAPGQMATAAVRGITGPDGRPMDKAQFLKGIRQSDIRPEWGEMLWDARFLYPPLFQLTRLVQAGAIDADTARDWAVKDRYPPEVVTALHKFWSEGTAAKPDSHVGKAQTQLWTATHSAYLAGDATEAVVDAKLQQIGVTADARPKVLALWKHEREVIRQRLTATQVKKAYKKPVTNPATGVPWTYDDALAELLSRGWSAQDAQTFLAE